MPNQPKTPMRSFRCEDDLWNEIGARAEADEVTRTTVIIEALKAYLGTR